MLAVITAAEKKGRNKVSSSTTRREIRGKRGTLWGKNPQRIGTTQFRLKVNEETGRVGRRLGPWLGNLLNPEAGLGIWGSTWSEGHKRG